MALAHCRRHSVVVRCRRCRCTSMAHSSSRKPAASWATTAGRAGGMSKLGGWQRGTAALRPPACANEQLLATIPTRLARAHGQCSCPPTHPPTWRLQGEGRQALLVGLVLLGQGERQ